MQSRFILIVNTILFFIASSFCFADKSDDQQRQNMALIAEGGGSFPMMGGGSFGGGGRFEYAISRFVSLIAPIEYRFVSMGGFSESSTFRVLTGGIGGKFYWSQLFWPQDLLRGFFMEAHANAGYAEEESGNPGADLRTKQRGFTFSLSGAIGYSYAFDFGLVVGGLVNMSGRAFASPIKQRGFIAHPNPELLIQLGFAF